ncbi:hypothetical protein WKI68_42320 [Streptomyces sp. MS1.HAVA.3]|uniref:ATP-grasp domain-containing protein n=1 Tax=Streptomyces caledonius TaxID=3134107 RepID=A0ABU8UDV7_9ACTN
MASMARLGHTAEPLEVSGPLEDVARALGELRPDLVFNLAEGWSGPWRQSAFPELYERLGLPYTGSGPQALALALDKYRTKLVLREAGVPTPPAVFLTPGAPAAGLGALSFPVIVKPNFESCSKGITSTSLAHTAQEAADLAAALLKEYPDGVLAEEYVPGRDITVPYLTAAGGPLPVAETTMPATATDGGIFDYDLKQDPARWQHLKVPPPSPRPSPARHATSRAWPSTRWAFGTWPEPTSASTPTGPSTSWRSTACQAFPATAPPTKPPSWRASTRTTAWPPPSSPPPSTAPHRSPDRLLPSPRHALNPTRLREGAPPTLIRRAGRGGQAGAGRPGRAG